MALRQRWRHLRSQPAGPAELLRTAIPLVIATGSLSVMHFCDRMFLAWYSSEAIRAVLPAGLLAYTLMCGFEALVGFGGTLVAHFHGAGHAGGCRAATHQALILACLAWPCVLLLIPVGHAALKLSGHDPAVQSLERLYFDWVMVGSLGSLLGHALAGFFSGRGDTRSTMWAHVAAAVVNIVLDYALIFGHWGCPRLGLQGAAMATALAQFVPPIWLGLKFVSPSLHRTYATRAWPRWDRALAARLLRYGLPAGGHALLDLTSFTVFVLLLGRFDPVEHAASNIVISINSLAFVPMIGLGQATTVVVGFYQGQRQPQWATRAGWTALSLALLYMGSVGLSYVLVPEWYLGWFVRNSGDGLSWAEVFPVARPLLWALAIWSVGDATDLALAGALKGAGDTRFVMVFSLIMSYGLFLGGEWVWIVLLHCNVYAAWAWSCVYTLAMAVGYVVRFARGRWKHIELVHPHMFEAT